MKKRPVLLSMSYKMKEKYVRKSLGQAYNFCSSKQEYKVQHR